MLENTRSGGNATIVRQHVIKHYSRPNLLPDHLQFRLCAEAAGRSNIGSVGFRFGAFTPGNAASTLGE